MYVEPVVLAGNVVRLEPLQMSHAEALFGASQDPTIWHYIPWRPDGTLDGVKRMVHSALEHQQKGEELPFVTVRLADNQVVGATRYMAISPENRGLEIGWTWLRPDARRTAINTECKYLLLRHAFEKLGAIRVQLKTDLRNTRSQQAIERLGALKEGVLRNHVIMPDGYYRHTVYYSILDTEWPQVKAGLEAKLR